MNINLSVKKADPNNLVISQSVASGSYGSNNYSVSFAIPGNNIHVAYGGETYVVRMRDIVLKVLEAVDAEVSDG